MIYLQKTKKQLNLNMYNRPKPQETDEDLLRMQEEFLQEKSKNCVKLAAIVISEKKNETGRNVQESASADIQEQISNTFEVIPTQNVGQIMERKSLGCCPQLQHNIPYTKGFPRAKRRDMALKSCGSKGSIFAQQMKKLKPNDSEVMDTSDSQEASTSQMSQSIKVPQQSYILTGPDSAEIHKENMGKLKDMSEAEILKEREHLITTMDPAIVAFLKARRRKHDPQDNRNLTIKQQNEAAQNVDIDQMEITKEIFKGPNSDKWLNFDVIEANKLAWMQDIDVKKINKKEAYEARFNFEGWLLPFMESEMSEKSRVLYHHGEEPERPGYTLQELFQLSRSNVIQQKIIALNTISNILSLHSTGIYEEVIDLPLEQIFFVLRFCLDDNTPSILNASIKAMRNLVHSKIDETCLDCLLGFGLGLVQPVLAVDRETEDDDRVNDQQMAETNLVKCLARTDILTRIRYIINTIQPTMETVIYCIDILIRLARDSDFICLKVYKCENLLASIVQHFLPTNLSCGSYGMPLLQAVKLIRIMSARSRKIAQEILRKHKVMDSIICYLSSDTYSSNAAGLKLQAECLHLWATFVHYKLSGDYIQSGNPVLLQLLNYHLRNTNLEVETTFVRQTHVGALLNLLGHCARNFKLAPEYLDLLQQCTSKWTKQFMNLTECSCGKLQIISSLFWCLSSNPLKSSEQLTLELVQSEAFSRITKFIKNGSMLLNNYETLKCSSNIKGVEAAAWHSSEHTIPLIQTSSPIPFLKSLAFYVETQNNVELKMAFINHPNLKRYLQELRKFDKYHLTSHWFTRIESGLIMDILKIAVNVKSHMDTGLFYELAVKCLSVFSTELKPDMQFILNNIIFDTNFYPSEVLLRNLDISEMQNSLMVTSLSNLEDIRRVYSQVLGMEKDVWDFEETLSIDVSNGNVIPIDWTYTPIIALYSSQQQNKLTVSEEEQIFTIRNCLRWILIYDNYFPELADSISPTDRFCRIACVFIGSDNLFLAQEIHTLLELCLNIVIKKCENQLNFDKPIEGLTSFQDFYTQLLEQYQGVSYGDVLFGNFILIPLAQRHSVKWRKILWSEYMGVVEMMNVTQDKCVCPLESFLNPLEEDMSLLKCYHKAILQNSIRKHSVLYTVATHHVEGFAAKKKIYKALNI